MRTLRTIVATVLTVTLTAAVASAVPVTKVRIESRVDWTSAGVGGVGGGTGTITLSGVSGTVKKAFLYWHGIDLTGPDGPGDGVYDNATVSLNGNSVTGVSLGDASTNCWGRGSSRAFRADVTQFVSGNGRYTVSGLSAKPGHSANGASLVVLFDDGNATNDRDLVFLEGNDSSLAENFPGEDDGWHATLSGINYRGGPVSVQLHVADGQDFADASLTFTGAHAVTINDTVGLWDGTSVPSAGTSRASNGSLWDIHTFNVTEAFGAPGLQNLTMNGMIGGDDCLGLVLLLVDLEPGSVIDPTAATVTSVTGNVQVTIPGDPLRTFQRVTGPTGPGTLVTKGMELTTGADGQVGGVCNNGSQFTLSPNSRVFLEDSLCNPADSGMLDITQGSFRLASVGAPASGRPIRAQNQVAGVRTPVSVGTASSSGADFSTTYNQVGNRGTAVTTVQSGTVAVMDAVTGAVSMVAAGQQNTVGEPVPGVVASILPSSRSVQVGNSATVFATILNAGRSRATVCAPSLVTNVPTIFSFQTTDPTSNQVVGTRSTPVSIPPGLPGQTFVLAFTPTAEIPPTDLTLSFACGQTQAPVTSGVNTMLLSASATPIPDIVALAATPDNNGIVNLSPSTGAGVFSVATVNVGVAGSITASADTGGVPLPVAISVCQTNPATGVCLGAPAGSVTITINAGATPTFGIFPTGTGAPVPFDPATNRIFVRFKDAGGVTRGSTSVAVRTQ